VIQEAPRSVGPRGGRASAFTPTPASEIRYSLADDPDARPTSASGSRRAASSSMRLIVALLIGGSLIFVGILLVNRFVRRGNVEAGSQNGNVEELLAAYEKALAAGDLSSASEKANEARKLADSEPRVAKAVAKVAVAKAELAWLELLLLPSADAGRSVVHRRYQTEIEEAQKATERAALLAPNDVEVARSVLDTKRILGDLAAAQRLRSSVDSVASDPETQLSLGALELLGELPPGALGKLERATAGEKQAGRARSIYIYALARANDAKRARVELDELAKLAKPHPLEAALRRFVERVEKGEKIAFRSGDVPTPKSAEASSVDVSAPLKAAEDALARRDSKKAEALFQQVLAADAENADALVGLAQIAKQTGNTKQAVAFLERAVAKHPEHAKALLALADAKWDGGEANLARPLYQRALDGGLTGAGVERAKTRATAAAVATGGTVPPDVPTAPTTTATTTSEPLPTSPTSTTPPPFGQDPPPFGQDPPPPPKDPPPPPPPAPTNTVPGAPL
jgi:tetratricopeptide (TPR) repeat protein